MENRKRIIELLTAVRYTTNDIEKVADEICSLFNVSKQSELLKAFVDFHNYRNTGDKTIYYDEIEIFIDSL
tara:strand:+ start:399 stop:611 length:213 start_codon:yes stop_codon:yes gene_type:complete